jgi:hypothetical protein
VGRDCGAGAGSLCLVRELRLAVPHRRRHPGPGRPAAADAGEPRKTCASLTLQVDSPRWAGVPFTLRSGQALAADSAEVAIHFRPLPGTCPASGPAPNRTSSPWARQSPACGCPPRFTACAHLIRQMLTSGPVLLSRGGEAEEAWRITGPGDERLVGRRRPPAGNPSRPRGRCGRGSGWDDPRGRQGRRGSMRGR